jgi:peroxiredoxin Q/BCP
LGFDLTPFRAGSLLILAAVTLLGFGTAFGMPFLKKKTAVPHPDINRVLKAGDVAPDFSLPAQDGGTVNLKDLRGKWVVLYFYPYNESPGCTIEAHNFQRDLAEYEKAHAVVVGVSPDSPKRHKEFAAQQELTFKLLSDHKRKMAKSYGARHRLAMILKRPVLATFLVDPQGRIAKIWMDTEPRHHSTDVLAAITELEKKHTSKRSGSRVDGYGN